MPKPKMFKATVEFEVKAGNIETAKAMVEKEIDGLDSFTPLKLVKITVEGDLSSIVSVG